MEENYLPTLLRSLENVLRPLSMIERIAQKVLRANAKPNAREPKALTYYFSHRHVPLGATKHLVIFVPISSLIFLFYFFYPAVPEFTTQIMAFLFSSRKRATVVVVIINKLSSR